MSKLNESQRIKRNFRARKDWTNFRHQKNVEQKGKCYISGMKLTKTADLHHMDLNPDNYCDLSNPEHFVFLSSSMHETVHTLYSCIVHHGAVIVVRLLSVLQRMLDINGSGIDLKKELSSWVNSNE